MKERTSRIAVIGAGLVVITALLVVSPLFTADVSAQTDCTLSTVQGTYTFEAQGSVVGEDGTLVTYAEAGVWTLDGAGNAAGIISASMDGEPFARRDDFTATYELDRACVFAVVDAFGLQVDLYASSDGSHIMYFSPGFSGTMVRQ